MQGDTILSNTVRLWKLFEGYPDAYGTYSSTSENEVKGGKLEIKATARTTRSPVDEATWQRHVDGKEPLGVIPIRENNTCTWGVIDVDRYDISFADVVAAIKKEKLPLVPCRSKSGGVHLFLFMQAPVSAEMMQARLKEMAVLLAFGGSEIFPKQRTVVWDRGQLGSWLNMPYFNGDETDRYGLKTGGLAMALSEFLDEAEAARQPPDFLVDRSFRKKPERDPDFGDGPPCMQHLAASGYPEGSRNKGLFNLATFAKKKYGTRWQDMVEEWNRKFFDPPLPAMEVLQIIKSQEKKDYNYTCKEHPICAHCNSSLCRTRKFGVGGDDDYPTITGLSVLDSDPPLWFVDIDDDRQIELSTDDLQNYKLFHKVCMEKLFVCYRMMKPDSWLSIVSTAMRDAVRIEAPAEVGRSGQFAELFEDFLYNRHRGEVLEDLLVGRPFLNLDDGNHYFRLRDLMHFLDVANFRSYTSQQVTTRVKMQYGGGSKFFNIKGKGVNTWYVPASNFTPIPTLSLPKLDGEPI